MFTCKFRELKPIKFIFNLLNKLGGRKQSRTSENPWQRDLDTLAARYEKALTTYEVSGHSEEVDQLRQLCDEVREADGKADRIVVRKVEKRSSDTTAVDLKAWWGQSVATWDPINAKNVDSIDQQRRPRKSKWFDKV